MKEQVDENNLIPGQIYEDHPENFYCPQLMFVEKTIKHKKEAFVFKIANPELTNNYIEEDGLVYISTGGRYYKPFKI